MKLKLTISNLFVIGVIFLIIFPKGGFKVGNIPITWGYIYLGILSIFIFITRFNNSNKLYVSTNVILAYVATIPFIIYATLNIIFRGTISSLGNLFSLYVSLAFIPLLFLILVHYYLNKLDRDYVEKIIVNAILVVCIYGILLFIYKQVTGHFIEIPYITINSGDTGGIMDYKYNARGSVSKLISTYNNGNIFGVCILILFPLFYSKNDKLWKTLIVSIALFLTLSRTVWLGLLLFFIIEYRNKLISLLKVYFSVLVGLFILSSLFLSRSFQYGSLTNFVTDSNLGGRLEKILMVNKITLFGMKQYEVIEEITYLSVFEQFGIIGLVLFGFSLVYPIYLFSKNQKNYRYYPILGCIIYLFISFSDGCIMFIPTMVFYYFTLSLAFCSNNAPKNNISNTV